MIKQDIKNTTPDEKQPRKINGKKGFKKTYPPINITTDSIELSNIIIYPFEKKAVSTTAYEWQRTGSFRDDYCVNIRVFGVFQTSISWKVAASMCDNFAGTEIKTVDEWKHYNKIARGMVSSAKGGPQYGKEPVQSV